MEDKAKHQINISAPNLLNICVDQMCGGEIKGRLYHCYTQEPTIFSNVVELIRHAEQLFDRIAFPQASTRTRSFVENAAVRMEKRPEKLFGTEKLLEYKGDLGTFITFVKFRQNSTWQGEMFWVEGETKNYFSNILDLIKMIDHRVDV